MVEVFYSADANADGGVTQYEPGDTDSRQFQTADSNKDGKLQMREVLNFRARNF